MPQPLTVGRIPEPGTEIAPGIKFDLLLGGKIWSYTITSKENTRAATDAWISSMMALVKDWPAGKPYFALHDMAHFKGGPSPYTNGRVNELRAFRPDVPGYAAVILPNSMFTQLIKLLVRASNSSNRSKVVSEVFFTRDTGLAWLEKRIIEAPQAVQATR